MTCKCDGDCTPCEMHGFCHLCEEETAWRMGYVKGRMEGVILAMVGVSVFMGLITLAALLGGHLG